MKNLILTLLILSLNFFTYGQEITDIRFEHQNGVLFEFGGNGYSINYERILINMNEFKFSSQLGISYYPPSTSIRVIWLPTSITGIWSFGKHHLELGVGYIFIREALRDSVNNTVGWHWTEIFTSRLGYRYQVPNKHFIMRVGYIPSIELENNKEFHSAVGLSFGYSF